MHITLSLSSVVTTVSVVTDDDPPEVRKRYEEDYHRQ
jgi:hypothetical protein